MKSDIKISAKDLYFRPLVYLWKRDEEYLYIGSSLVGLSRLYNHNVIKARVCLETDEIEVIYTSDARNLEKQLIIKYKPIYNRVGKLEHKKICLSCNEEFDASSQAAIRLCEKCRKEHSTKTLYEIKYGAIDRSK